MADPTHWESETKRLAKAFVAKAKQEGDSGQIHRGALRFAAVAVAGELATTLGIMPWFAGAAEAAALACFNAWAGGFGRTGLREHRQILERVRNAIQAGQSRFASIPHGKTYGDAFERDGGSSNREGEARSLSTLGYLHDIEPGKPCYLFHDSGWAEILAGCDPKEAAAVLQHYGFLVPGDGGRPKRKQRVGDQSPRFYTVRATILEWEAGDLAACAVSPADPSTTAGQRPGGASPSAPGWDDYDYGAGDPVPGFD